MHVLQALEPLFDKLPKLRTRYKYAKNMIRVLSLKNPQLYKVLGAKMAITERFQSSSFKSARKASAVKCYIHTYVTE